MNYIDKEIQLQQKYIRHCEGKIIEIQGEYNKLSCWEKFMLFFKGNPYREREIFYLRSINEHYENLFTLHNSYNELERKSQ